jgi:signal transduction histidine kinase
VVGVLDYFTGYERPLLIFYLIPISIGTWRVGRNFGYVLSVLSTAAWIISDLAAGIPAIRFWDVTMGFFSYVIFTWLLSRWRSLLNELDQRVRERTTALRQEIVARKRLEQEVAEASERERRRLGQDLHDGICQHLTGTALVAQAMSERLAAKLAPETKQAEKVVRLVEKGIEMTRNLARGLFSPDLEAEGLAVALQGLAESTREHTGVQCEFRGNAPARVRNSATATQLYRIAQEAVTNALKHGRAARITIELLAAPPMLTLTITDDGVGLPNPLPESEGLGLRIMAHGASMIGGEFSIERNGANGTAVKCMLKAEREDFSQENESTEV